MYPDIDRLWKMGTLYEVVLMDWSCGPQLASARPVSVDSLRGKWTNEERVVLRLVEKEIPLSMVPLRYRRTCLQ